MLSPLQERLWKLMAQIPEAETVALAGGAALIVRGVVDRPTHDLDFFATSAEEVNRVLPSLEASLRNAGLEVRRIQVTDGFVRLLVASDVETTTVDLSWDARRFPLEQTTHGAILAEDELAGDKLLALFGRAAARDFVDVAALASRYGLERLCSLAAEKDPGFDRSILAHMLRSFDRLPRADFDVDDSEFARLRDEVDTWRQQLEIEIRDSPGREPGGDTSSP
jgi:hypothetical protein